MDKIKLTFPAWHNHKWQFPLTKLLSQFKQKISKRTRIFTLLEISNSALPKVIGEVQIHLPIWQFYLPINIPINSHLVTPIQVNDSERGQESQPCLLHK